MTHGGLERFQLCNRHWSASPCPFIHANNRPFSDGTCRACSWRKGRYMRNLGEPDTFRSWKLQTGWSLLLNSVRGPPTAYFPPETSENALSFFAHDHSHMEIAYVTSASTVIQAERSREVLSQISYVSLVTSSFWDKKAHECQIIVVLMDALDILLGTTVSIHFTFVWQWWIVIVMFDNWHYWK